MENFFYKITRAWKAISIVCPAVYAITGTLKRLCDSKKSLEKAKKIKKIQNPVFPQDLSLLPSLSPNARHPVNERNLGPKTEFG